jgi:hypothetical protein
MNMSEPEARGPEDMTRHWSGAPPAKRLHPLERNPL